MSDEDWSVVVTYVKLIILAVEQRKYEELYTVVEVMHGFMAQAMDKEIKEYAE